MENLPAELIEKIFRYLDLKSLEHLEPTCRRWSEIIALRFYQPALAAQSSAVRRQLAAYGWRPAGKNTSALIKRLYGTVMDELPGCWRGAEGATRPTVGPEVTLGEYEVGTEIALTKQVSAICVYEEKLYVGMEGSIVEVRQLPSFTLLTTLNQDLTVAHNEAARKSCIMCLHGRTLAVIGPNRDKVRLFNTDTDDMVGEIETRLGPVYHIAISSNLLILLSGWSILYWRIDSEQPHLVRGQYKGVITDFMGEPQFQNWLESHEAVVNSRWVVTTATRTREPEGEAGLRVCFFLHVRRVGADGHISSLLRPERSQLPPTASDISGLCLSNADLLAIGWILQGQVVLSIMNLSSGDILREVCSNHHLASVMVPLQWEENKIFMKIIPQADNAEEYGVSLGWYEPSTGGRVEVPEVCLDSAMDLLHVDATRVLRITTKLTLASRAHIEYDMDEEVYAEIERLSAADGADRPKFVVKGRLYSFWPAGQPCLVGEQSSV